MAKSLGDYNIEKSSSSDLTNIKWTLKNQSNSKLKKKNTGKRSKSTPTNIIYSQKSKYETTTKKEFKIKVTEVEKIKKKNSDKKFQKSSASNSMIKQGFKRPGR